MQMCDDGHDEVCYEVRECPVCFEMFRLEDEIKDAEERLEIAISELDEANKKIKPE